VGGDRGDWIDITGQGRAREYGDERVEELGMDRGWDG